MRLAEDSNGWKASGIKRRDFRHTHGDPEIPKPRSPKKKTRKRVTCKHVWVEVSFEEYMTYRRAGQSFPYWLYYVKADEEPAYWKGVTTYFVCAGCEETKTKTNEGKRRAISFREYGRRR